MPAPVQRIYHSLYSNVINPADLVISMADGYYYGDRTLEKFVQLNGTHGGLSRESTDSFLMSSAFEAPAYSRPQEILPVINRTLAWAPHIPCVDYAWLDQYRRQATPAPASQPASGYPARLRHPAGDFSAGPAGGDAH